jgi:hypothetical protein
MATAATLADPEASARREDFVSRAMAALGAPTAGPALDLATDAKQADKGALAAYIEAFAAVLAAEARASAGGGDRRADQAAARHALALAAIQQLDANASNQLAMESMLLRMRGV